MKRNTTFRLPLSATFSTHQRADGKFVAHALDFDLVSVDDSKKKALDKLRFSVKTYVEYGLSNDWVADILFPAPTEFWSRVAHSKMVEMMEPIEIEDRRLMVYNLQDESRAAA